MLVNVLKQLVKTGVVGIGITTSNLREYLKQIKQEILEDAKKSVKKVEPVNSGLVTNPDEEDFNFWIGFEQEYFIRSAHNKDVLGFEKGGTVDPQGKYYCGVGGQIVGRELSDEHLDYCLDLGINVEGTNAEVALGQWEYQIFSKGKLSAADDLWMSRYILHKLA